MTQTSTQYSVRPIGPDDFGQVLELVNADRLPGQPLASPEMLAEALAGRSAISSDWWAELTEVTTEVAVTGDGQIAGVLSHATRSRDNTSVLMWMHAAENPQIISALLDHSLTVAGDRRAEAFPFATALGLGLEALPVRHRPATHAALLDRGFTATDLWRYLRTPLPTTDSPAQAASRPTGDIRRTLQIRENERLVGEAIVGMPVQGIGVLWWIGLEPQARELDLDKALLGSSLQFLSSAGAAEVILFAPSSGIDESLLALYEQAGFTEVDRLYGYRRDSQ